MAPRPRRRGRQRRNRSSQLSPRPFVILDETIARPAAGATVTLHVSDITLRDKRRPFRILGVSLEGATDSLPLVMNLRVYGPYTQSDNIIASGMFVFDTKTKRHTLTCRNPQWFPSNTAAATVIWVIDGICPERGFTSTATVICRTRLQYGLEEQEEKCTVLPTLPRLGDETEYDTCDSL